MHILGELPHTRVVLKVKASHCFPNVRLACSYRRACGESAIILRLVSRRVLVPGSSRRPFHRRGGTKTRPSKSFEVLNDLANQHLALAQGQQMVASRKHLPGGYHAISHVKASSGEESAETAELGVVLPLFWYISGPKHFPFPGYSKWRIFLFRGYSELSITGYFNPGTSSIC